MSKADERRAAQEQAWIEELAAMQERPNIPPVEADPDRRSWRSRCTGWKRGYHERARTTPLGAPIWRCRWCAQDLKNPA